MGGSSTQSSCCLKARSALITVSALSTPIRILFLKGVLFPSSLMQANVLSLEGYTHRWTRSLAVMSPGSNKSPLSLSSCGPAGTEVRILLSSHRVILPFEWQSDGEKDARVQQDCNLLRTNPLCSPCQVFVLARIAVVDPEEPH